MSLILEALKKSERQRHLGESPSLGSPVMAVSRRRSMLPALIILILLGLIALWWFKRDTDGPVVPAQAPPVAATAPAPVATDSTTFNDAPITSATPPADTRREVAQSTAASRQPRSKVPPDATSGLAPDLREKVKSGEVVVPNTQLLKPGQPATIDEPAQAAAAAGADDAQAEQNAAAAAMAQAAAAGKTNPDKLESVADTAATPAAAVSAPAPVPAAPAPAPAPAAQSTATTAPAVAPASDIQLIWELPYATRREIPEIRLTMHVYADQPAQRFVIINDDRQVEGDAVGDLKLIEIRRDGVVFDFEGQRFLYPRGGR
ncbi:general secretion pathway protein GspB [Dokdonella sp.]|uniref:general secretion pathway protein GspB n=1 Tax=Dokdonella sp. TaxID=2291710 RepID=UPI003C362A82